MKRMVRRATLTRTMAWRAEKRGILPAWQLLNECVCMYLVVHLGRLEHWYQGVWGCAVAEGRACPITTAKGRADSAQGFSPLVESHVRRQKFITHY